MSWREILSLVFGYQKPVLVPIPKNNQPVKR